MAKKRKKLPKEHREAISKAMLKYHRSKKRNNKPKRSAPVKFERGVVEWNRGAKPLKRAGKGSARDRLSLRNALSKSRKQAKARALRPAKRPVV